MRILNGRIATAVAGSIVAVALCAAPGVSAAGGFIWTPHYGTAECGHKVCTYSFVHTNTSNTDDSNNNNDPAPNTATVPEPGTLALALIGAAGLLGAQLRRRRSRKRDDSSRE